MVTELTTTLVTFTVGAVLFQYGITMEPRGTTFALVAGSIVETLETDTAEGVTAGHVSHVNVVVALTLVT